MQRKQSVEVEGEGHGDEGGDGDKQGNVALFYRPPESSAGVITRDENTLN